MNIVLIYKINNLLLFQIKVIKNIMFVSYYYSFILLLTCYFCVYIYYGIFYCKDVMFVYIHVSKVL